MLLMFAILLAGMAGFLTYQKPWWGLWFVIFFNPMDLPLTIGAITIYTNEFLLTGIFIGWLLHLLNRRQLRQGIPWQAVAWAAPFLLAILLSGINALAVPSVIKQGLRWLQLLGLAWYTSSAIKKTAQMQWLMLGLVASGTLVSLWGVIQTLAGPTAAINAGQKLLTLYQGSIMRAYSTFGHSNQFAGYIILVIPVAFIQFVEAHRVWERVVIGSCTLIMITALIFTFTRGAWLAMILVGAVLIYLNVPKKLFLIGALIMALSVTIFLLNQGPLEKARVAVMQRVNSFGHPEQEDSVNFRKLCVQTAMKMFREHPLLGFGAGEYSRNIRRYFDEKYYAWAAIDKHIHNLYLQILIETGILGMATFFLWLGVYLFQLFSCFIKMEAGYQSQLLSGLLAGMAAFLIHNNFDVVTIFARGIHFGLILGIGLAILRLKEVPGASNSQAQPV